MSEAVASTALQSPSIPLWVYAYNLIGFQLVWFFSIKTASDWSIVALLLFYISHIAILYKLYKTRFSIVNESLLVALCIAFGVFFEAIKSVLGIWQGFSGFSFAPIWLLSIWGALGCCMHIGFAFLQNRLLIAALLGSVFAPLSYFGGAALSPEYALSSTLYSVLVVSCLWLFIMPLLAFVAGRLPPYLVIEPG